MLRRTSPWALAWALAIATPAAAAAPDVIPEKGVVVLGEQTRLSVQVRTGGRPGALRGAASSGELSEGERTGPGEIRYLWTVPSSRVPSFALLLFWLETGDAPPEVGVARIALVGRTELEIDTEPRAQIRVRVGAGVFGPVRADATGKAKVAVEVPPGVGEARVLGEREGKQTALTVPLDVPPANPLVALLGPSPFYAEGRGWLWVFDASETHAEKIQVALQGGQARLAATTRSGALFELAPDPLASRISALATVRGNPAAKAQAAAELLRGPRPPVVPAMEPALPSPAAAPPPPPSRGPPLDAASFTPGALLGGFYGGGASLGWAVGVQIGYRLVGPWRVELELQVRRATMSTVLSLGPFESAITALPLLVAGRFRALDAGPWLLDVRAGGGGLPFVHLATSSFQPAFSETGLGWEAFAGGELGYRIGPLRVFLDVRGTLSPVSTPRVKGHLGGLFVALGARGAP